MDKNRIKSLPEISWKNLRLLIQKLGEGFPSPSTTGGFGFLKEIGFIENGQLTESGRNMFVEVFIKKNSEREKGLLLEAMLNYPAALALQQYLWGVKEPGIDQVVTVLRATNFVINSNSSAVTHLLDILNFAGFLRYDKRKKKIRMLLPPSDIIVPKSVFISPDRPFSNIFWTKKALLGCNDFIYWLDKHFQKEGLDWLWSVADANKIKEIKILSLNISGNRSDEMYSRLKKELANKGISLFWNTIDSKDIRDQHDRWIIGQNYLLNLPNVNAINSGQHSEIIESSNFKEALVAFGKYWALSKEIGI